MKEKTMTIITMGGHITFTGFHRKDLEKPNWHYYEDNEGNIFHFRKQHMVAVLENYGAKDTSSQFVPTVN